MANNNRHEEPGESQPVALKIIKPGMDTKEVIARFDAERQALALMDHPNIAQVLDAGATQSGRPFFCQNTATANDCELETDWSCSSPFAEPFNTGIKRASSTEM